MVQIQRLSKFLLPIIIFVSAALGVLRFNSLQVGTSYDDAHYIILAESLSSGQGYQPINFPQPQIEWAFPPGWPILLSVPTYLFPGNYTVLKLFTWILWLASLPLIHRIFSTRVESPYLEILMGLTALNPFLVGTSVTVMSESAYLFFSLVVFTLFDTWNSKAEKTNYGILLLIAVAAWYAQLIRSVGVSIFAALLLYFLYKRRFREAGITVVIFAFGTLLQTWLNLRNGGSLISSGYESQVFNSSIIEKIGQMGSNALGYFNAVLSNSLVPVFGEKITTLVGPTIPLLANGIIVLLILSGLAISNKRLGAANLYLAIYILAILAFWNPRVGSVKGRFLIPLIPFLYFYLIQGMRWVINKLTGNNSARTAWLVAILTCLIMLLSLGRNLQDWLSPVRNQITDISIGAEWISRNAPPKAIIMVNEPVAVYVHVHRKTVAYPVNRQDFERYLNNQGINYILISPKLQSPRTTQLDEFARTKLLPYLQANPDRFTLVYSNSEYNVSVYKYEAGSYNK